MLGNLNGWHLVIILFLVLLLFGAPKLPGLARSIGQSMKIFKSEIKTDKDDGDDASHNDGTRPTTETSHASEPTPTETTSTSEKPTDDPTSRP